MIKYDKIYIVLFKAWLTHILSQKALNLRKGHEKKL